MLVPLKHDMLMESVPRLARFVPPIYNLFYWAACRRTLHNRTKECWQHAWLLAGIPRERVETVTRVVVGEYFWPRSSLFFPDDECFVVFCFWRWSLTDGLGLPACIEAIERKLATKIQGELLSSLARITFGEFCKRLSGGTGFCSDMGQSCRADTFLGRDGGTTARRTSVPGELADGCFGGGWGSVGN